MPDYTDLGLTSNFQSVNSLGQNSVFVNGADFDLNQDRSIITKSKLGTGVIRSVNMGTAVIGTAQIGTLSFNEISGGTAILGGTLNGNGLIIVKSQSGGTTAVINFDGFNGGTKGMILAGSTTTSADAIVYPVLTNGSLSRLQFDVLNAAIIFETDERGFLFTASNGTLGSVICTIGTGNFLRILNGDGGTLMDINGNTGDLRIKGTIQQNTAF